MKTPTINSRILKLEVLKGTATRTSVNAVESRTTSLESDISTLQTDVSAAESDISTLQGNVATLTQGIQDAVSAHNTATDSHADIRTSVNAVESRTTSLEGDISTAQSDISTLQTDVSTLQTDVSAAEGDISTLQGNVATLAQDIVDAVSAHNTATDSHADIRTLIAGKQAALTISTVGTALLNIPTPAAQKIPRINADGSVTLIDVPSGGGGGGGARGLYSGLMSETVPTQSSTGLTTWVNQGGATAADTPIGLQVVNPTTSSNDNIRGLVVPVPSTPYTLTALLELASIAGNYPCAHLGWADSASTKTHIVALCGDGRSGLIYAANYSGWVFSGAPVFTRDGRRVWLRFSDDGTAIAVQWSISGVYWHTLYSGAKASSHLGAAGYNRLFFGASSGSITGVATLLSWSID